MLMEERNENYIERYTTYSIRNVHEEQVMRYIDKRPTHVQAYINNISVPKSLDELLYFIYEHGCYSVEDILMEEETNWTAPKWTKIGDIVFFMHAKYGHSYLTALRTELNNTKFRYSRKDYKLMIEWIERGLALNKKYGGKIYVIAQVSGMPEYYDLDDEDNIYHWKSRVYVDMDQVTVLENPVDISEFNDFIMVSRQSAITPVFGNDFLKLKKIISNKNKIPDFLKISDATPIPLQRINKENWINLSNEYRRNFMLESQFRTYYVNYLLSELGDRKTIYRECRCRKQGIPDSFVDNVIYIKGKYLPVEVKLSIFTQSDIKDQVRKYCEDEFIVLDTKKNRIVEKKDIHNNFCLIIDTEHIYLFDNIKNQVEIICDLDDIKNNIKSLENKLYKKLNN